MIVNDETELLKGNESYLLQQLISRQMHAHTFELAEMCTIFVDTLHQPYIKYNNNMVKMVISLITRESL